MATMSRALREALESNCATGVDELLRDKKASDLEVLLSMVDASSREDPGRRQNAIELLGLWGNPSAAAPIRALLPHLDDRGRINAVDALGRLGTPEALEGVLESAKDPSPDVRRFAAYALARIGSREALSRLADMSASDPEGFVRAAATKALQT
jgi:HEAT repeat protein